MECPLLGVKRTSISGDWMSACSQKQSFDPRRSSGRDKRDAARQLDPDQVSALNTLLRENRSSLAGWTGRPSNHGRPTSDVAREESHDEP